MAAIHPTAIIDPRAELADDVTVGPWCVLSGPVRLGPGTRLIGNVYLTGPLTLGSNNTLYPFCVLGMEPQDRKFDPATQGSGARVGDRNVFREGFTLHRATKDRPTTVGDDNYFMANTHVGHDSVVGNFCTLANSSALAGHVVIGDMVNLGGCAAVHQFCRMGRLSMISGLEGVVGDVPPFCVALTTRRVSMLNIVGLRRSGLRAHVKPLKKAFHILYQERLSNPGAVRRIRAELGDDPLCVELADFIASSRRGITPYGLLEKTQDNSAG